MNKPKKRKRVLAGQKYELRGGGRQATVKVLDTFGQGVYAVIKILHLRSEKRPRST